MMMLICVLYSVVVTICNIDAGYILFILYLKDVSREAYED